MLEYEYKNEEMEYINITILCKISKNLKQTHRKHKLNQALNLIHTCLPTKNQNNYNPREWD